jgi:hypothetical protein
MRVGDDLLEIHDSFFIGSDVFYSYLVRNGCWWVREKQKIRRRSWMARKPRGGAFCAAIFQIM